MSRRSGFLALARADGGATAVEFAIILPVFVTLLFGIFEFSRMVFVSSSVQHAIDRAARLAVIDSDVTNSDIEAEIANFLSVSGNPPVSISVVRTMIGTTNVAQVTAQYDHTVSGPFIPAFKVQWDFETVVPLR
jgi:Flp pilus assembly protein TadG